jgi:hypothetical protein
LPDGTTIALPADRDPRELFADWLVNDRRFAQSMANRAWYWLMGRGIVHEPDDFAAENPPSNPELLEYLGRQLVASGYDFRQLLRLILNSQTYQRSSIVRGDNPPPAELFAVYPLRRLDAEVLIDAICQITGTSERYSSAIPEPFTFLPEGHRSVALPDASISSPFLELFGRPTRDTGLASERDNCITPSQRLHLLNSSHVQRKLEQWPRLRAIAQPNRPVQPIVTELYLTILSRFPTEQELRVAAEYVRSGNVSPREAAVDLAWALINSPESLYRH